MYISQHTVYKVKYPVSGIKKVMWIAVPGELMSKFTMPNHEYRAGYMMQLYKCMRLQIMHYARSFF